MQKYIIRERVLDPKKMLRDGEMSITGNREPLGDALYDPKNTIDQDTVDGFILTINLIY